MSAGLLPLRQLTVWLVSGVGKAQNDYPGVWEWPVGGIILPLLGTALHLLLNHQTLSRKGRRVRRGHRPAHHAFAVTLVPLLHWRGSLGARGSKAQVGSVSFMPLGTIIWTLKQH